MKTKLILVFFFVISISTAFAQVNNKLSPAFRYLISHPLNNETISNYPDLYKVETVEGFNSNTGLYEKGYVCIIYTKNANILIDRGITVQSVLPNFVTAWVSLYQISQLSEMSEVSYIDAPKIVLPNNDICVGSSGASLLNAGRLNNTIYKGDGVIVGVFDTGIDWDHLDFRNPSDTTKSRILRIWDQTITPIAGEISPTGLNYGVEYTQTHLNNELDGTPAGYVREKDLNGHGTHVTGTAAGNGAALSTKKFAGIAPNADIVVVKGGNTNFSTTNIINALTYFQNIATALGKPIVVNMSIGGQSGAHDGTNAEEIAVDNFSSAAAGRVVAIAAGNDNGSLIHKQVALAANVSNSITVNVPTASGSTSTDVFQISIYANNANAVNTVVTMPGGTTVTANAGQSISPSVLSNAATVYLENVVDAASGLRSIVLYVARNTTTANPSGTWTITLTNTTATALTIDGWLDYKGANFRNTTVSGGDNNYLVASPGTATNAITVGSFMGKLDWYTTSTTAAGGVAYSSGQQDNISTFSSRGPRRDNVQKPNITANGQAVVSCLASDAGISATSSTIVIQGLYRAIQGTSMATPEVAGCVALMLQVKPTATFSQIRNAITTTATKDNFTTATDNATWGSGKIDVFKAASSLVTCPTFKRETYSYDSSTTSANNTTIGLGAHKVATRFTPTLTGKLGGVYFKTGSSIPTASFTIEIRTNGFGVPATLLGTMSIAPASISKFSWNYYDVSALNIDVTSGIDYFVVLIPEATDFWSLGSESLTNSGRSFFFEFTSWNAIADLRIRSVVYNNAVSSSTSSTTIAACNSYNWNGTTYTSSGTYTYITTSSDGCDSVASLILTINALPVITAIAGTNTICKNSTTEFTNDSTGGVWSSNNVSIATIESNGVVTAVAAGSTTINYTITNAAGCSSSVNKLITVLPLPTVSSITGANSVCVNSSILLSTTTSGGVWSSVTPFVATITSNGFLTAGNLSGGTTIYYTVTDALTNCENAAGFVITVKSLPYVPAITGANAVCLNETINLFNTTTGGNWSSNNNAIATVNSNGVVAGIGAGMATITYNVTNANGCSKSLNADIIVLVQTTSSTSITACNSYSWNDNTYTSSGTYIYHTINSVGCDSAATLILSIKTNYSITASAASNGNISPNGVSTVCDGNNLTYTIAPNSGYSISNVIVDGVIQGAISTFTFNNITANHTISASFTSFCVPNSSITNASICSGGFYFFNGTSYSAAGTYIKHLTNIGGCDSAATLILKVISNLPNITGAASVCVGSTITLGNTQIGGVWNSIAGRATVNQNGVVTGTSIGSLATIKYTYTLGGCNLFTTKVIQVNAIPATPSIGYKAPFSNPQAGAPTGGFCVSKVFGVLGTLTGGAWSSTGCISVTNLGIATINTTGAGSLTYIYTDVNGCKNSRTMVGVGYTCVARGGNSEPLIGNVRTIEFELFPNPAKSYVSLKVETLVGEGEIIITDIYGKIVKSSILSMGINDINIANLSKGFYLISAITKEGKTTKKLIKE